MQSVSNISRYILAFIFLISGFVKAVDPLGLMYKLDEYFSPEVFSLEFLSPISLLISILVIAFELWLAIRLLLGYRNQVTLFMVVGLNFMFGFLTFYSAYFDVVKDCGCFGDFLKMSPWASFGKNIFLMLITILALFKTNDERNKIKFVGTWVILSFFLALMGISLWSLPIIDFRPYRLTADLKEGILIPEDAPENKYETLWYYKINGEEKSYKTHQEPWKIEGAKFVKRETQLIEKGYEPPMSDFVVYDTYGDDVSQDIIQTFNTGVWIIARGEEARDELKEMIEQIDHDYSHWIVITDRPIKEYTLPIFKGRVYFADTTLLKTMIRSQLGFFKLSNGVITRKSHSWEAIIVNALF